MTFAERLACVALAALLPAVAVAQDTAVEFRLVAAPNNITGCIVADPQFTRVHTFAVKKGGQAELTAPGGITTGMKFEKPRIYMTDYEMGHFDLHVVADVRAKTLTVSDRNLGCKWTAKKE